jgi:choline kinase
MGFMNLFVVALLNFTWSIVYLMKVIMLAAGIGRRLHGEENDQPPKALLRFGGKTLLARHIEILYGYGIEQMIIVVGHRKETLQSEALATIADLGAPENFLQFIFNSRYQESGLLSLGMADAVLCGGDDILFMDADVLYHPELIRRIIQSLHKNCFSIDREFEYGDEPVKVCLKDGKIIDFGKVVTDDYEVIGEWPGFLKMSSKIAASVADAVQNHIQEDVNFVDYETAMRDVLLTEPLGTFGCEDITGIPWTEIDFPDDVIHAGEVILPSMQNFNVDSLKSD